MQNIDQKLIQSSHIKVIKTGDIYEIFTYLKPYLYNFGTICDNTTEREGQLRREDSIKRAQAKVRRLVNANARVYGYMPIFVTYTFRDDVEDIKVATRYFTEHIKELKRSHFGHLRYLAVPEVQEKRAEKYGVNVWHFHCIFFDLPYIRGIKTIFETNWKYGFIKIKAIDKVRNVGAYVSKYFGKQWASSRLKGQKSFFSSSRLYQPEIMRSLDRVPELSTMIEEYSSSYDSLRFGRVDYSQYKIYKKNEI